MNCLGELCEETDQTTINEMIDQTQGILHSDQWEDQKLTPYKRAVLVVAKILEYAEIGGMEPEDCGIVLEALLNLLGAICEEEGDENTVAAMLDKVQEILDADHWEQVA